MHSGFRIVSLAAASALLVSLSPLSAGAAEACVSSPEVRSQVREMVADLRDDVKSRSARADTAHALVDALRTFRGADADTTAERQELGQQISAMAREMHTTDNQVSGKALRTSVASLREQRERGAFTAEERTALRALIDELKSTVTDRTDTRQEGRAVNAGFASVRQQFSCRPA
jgi:hypothetical protein